MAVLGQGEAGSAIAADLVAAGAIVRVYDPRVPAPDGTVACRDEGDAGAEADLVLSVNSAADAVVALRNAAPRLRDGAVWADLNTGSAALMVELAGQLATAAPKVAFVDVSLMAPVPGLGIRTPMLVSGDAGQRYADLMAPLGATIEVLAGPPGEAATRKLLRSVFYKGLAAAVIEALTAAEEAGLQNWLRANIAAELESFDAATLDRLLTGSHRHALRRSHEMAAAVALLTDLRVPARITAASQALLSELARADVPGAGTPAGH